MAIFLKRTIENPEILASCLVSVGVTNVTPNSAMSYRLPPINGAYFIDLTFTVMLGMRLCLIRRNDPNTFKINWCIGEKWELIPPLVAFVTKMVQEGKEDDLPFNSNIKPLYNDALFLQKLNKLGLNI